MEKVPRFAPFGLCHMTFVRRCEIGLPSPAFGIFGGFPTWHRQGRRSDFRPFPPPLRMKRIIALLALATAFTSGLHAAAPLVELRGCKLVRTDWADGDSFQIQTAEGTSQTIRLYGADCMEWHVNDKTDASRLAEQRRYFGIAGLGGSVKASAGAATDFGRQAAEETARALALPFTVRTAYSDARGDGRHPRVYAFVTTADGKDLAEHLVRAGLARAFGVSRETSDGKSAREYQASLRDVELVAAKAGAGIWAKTDWQRLSLERQEQRHEDEELEAATQSKKSAGISKLDPNSAARDELMAIPGIGEVTANRIIGGRPYKTLADLLNVDGIGPKSLERLKEFLAIPKLD